MNSTRNGKGMLSKKRIDRGPKIEVKNKVSLEEVSGNEIENEDNKNKIPRVTLPSSLRINNHIKNELQALVSMGHFGSFKEFLEDALNDYINNLPEGEQKQLEYIVNKLELKDYEKSIKNKK